MTVIENLYHGTKAAFDKFDIAYCGKTDCGLVGKGFYFTPNLQDAQYFAGRFGGKKGTPRVMQVHVTLERPFFIADNKLPDGRDLNDDIFPNGTTPKGARTLRKLIDDGGYDGVIFSRSKEYDRLWGNPSNPRIGVVQVVALAPTQVEIISKSV